MTFFEEAACTEAVGFWMVLVDKIIKPFCSSKLAELCRLMRIANALIETLKKLVAPDG